MEKDIKKMEQAIDWKGTVLKKLMNLELSGEAQKKLVKLEKAMKARKLSKFVANTKAERNGLKTSKEEKREEVDAKTLLQSVRYLYRELILNGMSERLRILYTKNEVLYYNQILHCTELSEIIKEVFEKLGLRG